MSHPSQHSTTPPAGATSRGPAQSLEAPDVREYGAPKDGQRQSTDRRLYMQLLSYTGAPDLSALAKELETSGLEAILYADLLDPAGLSVLFMSEDPVFFTGRVREFLAKSSFSKLTHRPEFTMFGRTYSIGYEQDLEDWLLKRPRRNVFDEKLGWAVWYPLRRKSEFETLTKEDQRSILMEHAKLGMAYGGADLAYDVRLSCYGLDTNDNEFVIGVLAKELHPISYLIHEMRKTRQTSLYIQNLGPFFVGRAVFRTHRSAHFA